MNEFEDIYEIYSKKVMRFLFSLTRDLDLSEELTQETFYQAIKSIDRYNGTCKMSVWLFQIAKHLFYNHLSQKKRNKTISIDDLIELPCSEKHDFINPEDQVVYKENLKKIWTCIYELDEPYREVFLLRVMNELQFRDIGEALEKSENWARVTYYRARLKLCEKIRSENCEVHHN